MAYMKRPFYGGFGSGFCCEPGRLSYRIYRAFRNNAVGKNAPTKIRGCNMR